jgi:hypothetical protein
MNVYELVSDNITNVGGPMGNNASSENWSKLFEKLKVAKEYAEQDYRLEAVRTGKDNREKIMWRGDSETWCSQDLGFVQYIIKKVRVH